MSLRFCATLLAAVVAAASLPTVAQQYPAKPVRVIVPFAPGGGSDFTGRLVAQKLTERIGQSFLVENRPGAGGNLGAEIVLKSPADGYTLLLISASYTVNPSVYKLAFDPISEATPIIQISGGPYVVAVHPSVPAHTLAEFIALAKKQPGKLAYGTSGNGSVMHVASQYFLDTAGIKVLHVPYKGTGPALQDTIGGQVQLIFESMSSISPHHRTGRLRGLAVTGPKRSPGFPDIPTIAESGVPGYEVTVWAGLITPVGVSKAVIAKLNDAVNQAMVSPALMEKYAANGVETVRSTPEEYGALIKREVEKYTALAKTLKLKVD